MQSLWKETVYFHAVSENELISLSQTAIGEFCFHRYYNFLYGIYKNILTKFVSLLE